MEALSAVFGILCIAGVAAFLFWLALWDVRQHWLRGQMKTWPAAHGRVLKSEAREYRAGRGGQRIYWLVGITYCFTTAGGGYFGGESEFRIETESEAEDLAHGLKDAEVEVRYRPDDPDTSLVCLPDGRIGSHPFRAGIS